MLLVRKITNTIWQMGIALPTKTYETSRMPHTGQYAKILNKCRLACTAHSHNHTYIQRLRPHTFHITRHCTRMEKGTIKLVPHIPEIRCIIQYHHTPALPHGLKEY